MKATELYARLEKDFIKSGMKDDWSGEHKTGEIRDFLTDRYKEKWMGPVCGNSKEINKVYTAVFPTDKVMQRVLDSGETDALLFVHHPAVWNPALSRPWQNMNINLLRKFRTKRISIFNLHAPLDEYMKYGTSYTLAEALKITPVKPFFPYSSAMAGVIGKTKIKTINELQKRFAEAVGHRVSLYDYGNNEIRGGLIGIVAGGGNDILAHQELDRERINILITGISKPNPNYKPSLEAHDFAKAHKINILGGTHYSTEMFACIAMCNYFRKLGLETEFIEGKPNLEDL